MFINRGLALLTRIPIVAPLGRPSDGVTCPRSHPAAESGADWAAATVARGSLLSPNLLQLRVQGRGRTLRRFRGGASVAAFLLGFWGRPPAHLGTTWDPKAQRARLNIGGPFSPIPDYPCPGVRNLASCFPKDGRTGRPFTAP